MMPDRRVSSPIFSPTRNIISAGRLYPRNAGHERFRSSKNCAVIDQVPLGRYFFFVGSVLLAMLFIADRYLPNSFSQSFMREARVDKSIIRIQSAHKWPE